MVASRDWAAWLTTRPSLRTAHRVVVTSLPKSGTNLATKALLAIPALRPSPFTLTGGALPPARSARAAVLMGVDWPRAVDRSAVRRRLRWTAPGSVTSGHLPWSRELADLLAAARARVIAVVRDPRDVAVSLPPYVMARPDHFLHARFARLDEGARILASINGLEADASGVTLQPLEARMASVLAWHDHADALLVRFEDLVGSRGGGSDDAQCATIQRMAEQAGCPIAPTLAADIGAGLFGGTSTFRRGQIGGWQDAFDREHRTAATARLAPLLLDLGYETGADWAW